VQINNAEKVFVYASSGGLGDVLMLLPGLADLSQGPKVEIIISVSYESLIEVIDLYLENRTNKITYEVVPFDTGFYAFLRYFLALRSKKFDSAYFPNSSNTGKALIALLMVSPKNLFNNIKVLFQKPRRAEHKISYYARRLGRGTAEINYRKIQTDFKQKSASLSLKTELPSLEAFAVITPGSSVLESHKRWPGSSYVDLIVGLKAKENLDVVLLGGRDEAGLLEQIHLQCKLRGVNCILAQPKSILGSISIINSARCLVSACCSAIHMGSLTDVRIIGLYGPTDFSYTGPWNYNFEIKNINLSCGPCYLKTPLGCGNPTCMYGITANSALDTIRRINLR